MLTTLAALCALSATLTGVFASPLRRENVITAADIIKVDPASASCANAPAAGECRTAEQAAPYITISFANFGITNFGEQAALVAVMLYETKDFEYDKNHFPGIAGQGTRNMQTPDHNLQYAEYLATVCTNCGITSAQVQHAEAQGPAAVLDLVNTDEWSFGSAAWFLATQCDASIRQELAAGTQAGWEAYLTECVHADENDKRNQLWSATIALGHW